MIFVNLIYRHFDILMPQYGQAKKLCVSGLCRNNVRAPYCKAWNPRYPSNTSECLQFPWIPLRYPQTTPKYPPDISRELKISTDDNRRQQMTTEPNRHPQTLTGAFEYVRKCLLAHVVVCWHLEFPGDVWGLFWGCLGGVLGYLSSIHGN